MSVVVCHRWHWVRKCVIIDTLSLVECHHWHYEWGCVSVLTLWVWCVIPYIYTLSEAVCHHWHFEFCRVSSLTLWVRLCAVADTMSSHWSCSHCGVCLVPCFVRGRTLALYLWLQSSRFSVGVASSLAHGPYVLPCEHRGLEVLTRLLLAW